MKIIYILCEGQTEESFINNVLCPYFVSMHICVIPIICTTKRVLGAKFKGGVSNVEKVIKESRRLARQHPNELVTTMFDYYGFPIPESIIAETKCCNSIYDKVYSIETEMNRIIGMQNFSFNFIIHEFEALLFCDVSAFRHANFSPNNIQRLQAIYDTFENPEEINNHIETAPSKRILSIQNDYAKVQSGTLIANKIGIETMKSKCPHFANWISFLQQR